MKFFPLEIAGAWLIEPEPISDLRGSLARTYSALEFSRAGLNTSWVQSSSVKNHRCGTLRGMHWQTHPHSEIKLVRCTFGAVFDAVTDMRPESKTYLKSTHVWLNHQNQHSIYIPAGVAHGMQTLTDDAELFYMMSATHHPSSATGARWDDPAFGIPWPDAPSGRTISEKDSSWPLLNQTS